MSAKTRAAWMPSCSTGSSRACRPCAIGLVSNGGHSDASRADGFRNGRTRVVEKTYDKYSDSFAEESVAVFSFLPGTSSVSGHFRSRSCHRARISPSPRLARRSTHAVGLACGSFSTARRTRCWPRRGNVDCVNWHERALLRPRRCHSATDDPQGASRPWTRSRRRRDGRRRAMMLEEYEHAKAPRANIYAEIVDSG